MKERKLVLYSIMKFNDEHIEEICEDIINQYKSGVCSCPMFNMTLVPEGDPVIDKAEELCNSYKKYKAILDKAGVPSGVLIQATIGHGWTLGKMFPFQPLIDFNSGTSRNTVCAYDEGFREYIYNATKKIALCRPSAIMIDDDFRLLTRVGQGCGCPIHMKKFNERAGTNFTREELFNAVEKKDEQGKKYYDLFVQLNHEPMVETAKIIRKAIDEVDPYIQGSYCCGGFNAIHDAEIAKILSGEKNPVVIRLNNGHYGALGTRFYSFDSFRAFRQVTKLKKYCDVILAETDTCPQNRYSTTAHALHSHFTCSLLEGVQGAKQWLTRTPYEPQSGVAYRKILSKYRDFYEEIARISNTLNWRGFSCYVSTDENIRFSDEVNSGWIGYVFDVLGLPVAFKSEPDGIVCADNKNIANYDDETILKLLKGKLLLASEAAKALIDKGYGKYLGVDVREWNGKMQKREDILCCNNNTSVQKAGKELVITNEKTEVLSKVMNTTTGCEPEYLYPGSTKFKNELGGTVYVFSGAPVVQHNLVEGYSFLTYSRKQQFINILKECGEASVYFEGDEEVYLKVANMQDGGYFVSLINECADPIEKIELTIDKKVKKVYKLNEKGERVKVKFTQNGDKLILKESAVVLNPVILFIY